jgi:hypothetical protein
LLDRGKAVGSEIPSNFPLLGLGIIVAIEVEDPEGVKMGVDRHVEGVRILAHSIVRTVLVHSGLVARVAVLCGSEEEENQEEDRPHYALNCIIN